MINDKEPRIDTSNCVIQARDTKKAWLAAEDINNKFFKNEMTTILMHKLDEPNEYLLTFAKNQEAAEQAQQAYLDELDEY